MLTLALVAVGCSGIRSTDPWEVASKACMKHKGVERAYCQTAVSIAQQACAAGIDRVACEADAQPICDAANELLQQLAPTICDIPRLGTAPTESL